MRLGVALRMMAGMLAGIGVAGPVLAEAVGNGGIVAMHKAGLSGEAIAAKVRSGSCDYDTSTAGLIALKRAEVPQAAIVAVIEQCSQRVTPGRGGTADGHAPGIFVAAGASEMVLRPSAASSLKLTGNGSILFPHMAWLVVPQPAAQVTVPDGKPTFRFHFLPQARGDSDFGTAVGDYAQSPTEFSLVKFRVVNGSRQVAVGRVQPYVEVSGIDPKNTLPFSVVDEGRGAFTVTMPQGLAPGQYGFVIIGERERRKGTLFRVYDFAVP